MQAFVTSNLLHSPSVRFWITPRICGKARTVLGNRKGYFIDAHAITADILFAGRRSRCAAEGSSRGTGRGSRGGLCGTSSVKKT